jgi:hypothetical protein
MVVNKMFSTVGECLDVWWEGKGGGGATYTHPRKDPTGVRTAETMYTGGRPAIVAVKYEFWGEIEG